MKLEQLRIFVAVAEFGSFSSAAVALDCTQSRISHSIAELERELEVRLLLRSHEGSRPTEVGLRVLDKARQMLGLEQDVRNAAGHQEPLEGRVRLSCFRSIGTHLLPYTVEALRAIHPGIVLEIDDSGDRLQVIQAVRERRVDLSIAQLPIGRGLQTETYLQDDYVLALPASLPVEPSFSWDQLDQLPFVRLNCAGADDVLARCRDTGFNASAERTVSNDTTIVAMIARGMGYSILPRLAIFPEPDDIRVIPVPVPARRQFALTGHPDVLQTPRVRAVLRLLRDPRMVAKTAAFQAGILRWS